MTDFIIRVEVPSKNIVEEFNDLSTLRTFLSKIFPDQQLPKIYIDQLQVLVEMNGSLQAHVCSHLIRIVPVPVIDPMQLELADLTTRKPEFLIECYNSSSNDKITQAKFRGSSAQDAIDSFYRFRPDLLPGFTYCNATAIKS